MTAIPSRTLSPWVFVGFAVASTGGPLALVALLGPDAIGGAAISASGLVTVLGVLTFVPVLYVWYRYSQRIATDGGLYEFVRAGGGLGVARVHAVVWSVSYFLYLPATVTQVVYELLPIGFPGLTPYRGWVQVGASVAIVGAVVAAERATLWVLAAVAATQVAMVLVLSYVLIHGGGAGAHSFMVGSAGGQLRRGAANVALFFVCASLPLYLGGEVIGGSRTVRRTLVWATLGVGALVVIGCFGYAALQGSVIAALPAPGFTATEVYSTHHVALLVLAVAAASTVSVIVAEYVALTRLLRAAAGVRIRTGALGVGALFVAASIASLANPDKVYDHALTVSLVALYVSQAIVFAVYPRWRRIQGTLGALDVAAAAAAFALMGFGLYVAVTQASF